MCENLENFSNKLLEQFTLRHLVKFSKNNDTMPFSVPGAAETRLYSYLRYFDN